MYGRISESPFDFDTDSIRTMRTHSDFKFLRIPVGILHKTSEEKVPTNGNDNARNTCHSSPLASSTRCLNLNTPACHRSASPSLGDALLRHGIFHYCYFSSTNVANTSPVYFSPEYFRSRKGEDMHVARIFCRLKWWYNASVPASPDTRRIICNYVVRRVKC